MNAETAVLFLSRDHDDSHPEAAQSRVSESLEPEDANINMQTKSDGRATSPDVLD